LASDLRTPLAKPLKHKTLSGLVLKRIGKNAKQAKREEPAVSK
jgi:hypothetical protein